MNDFMKAVHSRKLTGMEWRAQKATSTDALFYKLADQSESAIEKMINRLQSSSYGVVVVNSTKALPIRDAYFFNEEDFFKARRELANSLYPMPADKKWIAITGTNGKTTTVDIVRQLCIGKKMPVLTVGTLGVFLQSHKLEDFSLTSPDFIDLRKTIFRNREKFSLCALEASSHALEQRRLDGLCFDSIGWTSFSQDHLDYHKTLENYFEAKRKLIKQGRTPLVVSSLATELLARLGDDAIKARRFPELENKFFKSVFNKINLDVATGCLAQCGLVFDKNDAEKIKPPPGRFNVVENGGQLFVIDFAHTPDALENICKELKNSFPGKKLVCVFGCGGDRDKSKRPLMGAAASKHCDHVIVTSDNPRTEEPSSIAHDIETGLKGAGKHEIVLDRGEAIKKAFDDWKDSVILIAGKGHEPYIDAAGEKIPYSDMSTLKRIIDNDHS